MLKSSLRKCQITTTTTTREHLQTLQFSSRPANVSQGYLLPYLSMWESRLYCCFKTATKSCFILDLNILSDQNPTTVPHLIEIKDLNQFNGKRNQQRSKVDKKKNSKHFFLIEHHKISSVINRGRVKNRAKNVMIKNTMN